MTSKKEFIAYLVLCIYPAVETKLHTDACAQRLGAILLQKPQDKSWASIAYFSRPTNETETKYHNLELEMLIVVKIIERFHIRRYGSVLGVKYIERYTSTETLPYICTRAGEMRTPEIFGS